MDAVAQFRQTISRLYQRFNALQRGEKRCFGVTMTQCLTLELLDLEGSQTVRGLAEKLGLDTTTVTRVIDVMARDGLVRRARDERSDRRRVFVSLTGQGRRLAEKLERRGDDYCERILAGIPARERREMLHTLTRLVAAIDGLPGGASAQEAECPRNVKRGGSKRAGAGKAARGKERRYASSGRR